MLLRFGVMDKEKEEKARKNLYKKEVRKERSQESRD